VDIHSHLIPGIDDGCAVMEEAIACIEQLKSAGYVGSICTPHLWPQLYPLNTPQQVKLLCQHLSEDLAAAGVEYRIWPGGELRLFDGVIEWMERYGVPTLADSRCVLTDFWDQKWPRWFVKPFRWLIERKYQPIFAHPERVAASFNHPEMLDELRQMGVWLQGNFRCFTAEEGYHADRIVRQLMGEGKYNLLALDMHKPDTLPGRLDGIALASREFGADVVERLTNAAPRKLVLGL
jgi:protein-tyrosine phosphatase